MPGLVFTFAAEKERSAAQTSMRLASALAVARAGDAGIRFCALPRDAVLAQVAVLFSDLGRLDAFTRRLIAALKPTGIALAGLHAAYEAPA